MISFLTQKQDEFRMLWDTGKFNWNGSERNVLSLWRVWNIFIKPSLESAHKAGVEKERKRFLDQIERSIRMRKQNGDVGALDELALLKHFITSKEI